MRVFKSIDEITGQVGQDIGVSDWLAVDQARINLFAEATGDHQWIHTDPERARKELPTKTTIAHGFLTLSLIPFLNRQISEIQGVSRVLNYGLNKVRFTNMVATGKRVRLRSKLIGAEPKSGGTQLTFEYTLEIEGEQRPGFLAEMIYLYFA